VISIEVVITLTLLLLLAVSIYYNIREDVVHLRNIQIYTENERINQARLVDAHEAYSKVVRRCEVLEKVIEEIRG